MSVLVLGATGFIGPHLVGALASLGLDVVAVSRSGTGPHGVAADRRDAGAIRTLARRRRATAIIDLLAFTEADTLGLLEALDGHVDRWVMASSCDVYRNYEGLHRKADVEPILEPLAEDSPLRTTRYPYRLGRRRPADAPDAWMDDYDKIPLEAAARARPGLKATILRLPMVYGPGDRQRRFRWIVKPMAAGVRGLEIDPAWAAWRSTYGYVADVADALAAAAVHPAAENRTFNFGQAGLDHRGWIARFAAALRWRGEVVETPAPADSPIAALDLRYPLAADTGRFRQACGWREPTEPDEALSHTVADETARG
jgi:nucleoside-diphosphate-sugar epimerase